MKAPPTPRDEMMVGPIFTEMNSEMLSRMPRSPEPKLLISAGRSSPKEKKVCVQRGDG